jgi:hypothetical protein
MHATEVVHQAGIGSNFKQLPTTMPDARSAEHKTHARAVLNATDAAQLLQRSSMVMLLA